MALDAVLDGVTGHGGKFASRLVADALQGGRIESLHDLETVLEAANKALFQRGRGGFLLTTLSVALKTGDDLQVVSVGDSPVYVVRAREIVALTPTANGPLPPGIASAVGRLAQLAYTVTHVRLHPEDRVVLATDGLTNNISPTELASLVRGTASAQEAVSALGNRLGEKKRHNQGRADEHGGFTADDTTVLIRHL